MRGDNGTSQDKTVKTTDGRTVMGEKEKTNRWKDKQSSKADLTK